MQCRGAEVIDASYGPFPKGCLGGESLGTLELHDIPDPLRKRMKSHPVYADVWGGARVVEGGEGLAPAVIRQPEAAPSPAHWEASPSPQTCSPLQTGAARRKPGDKGSATGGQQHAVPSWGLLAGDTGD